MTKIVLKNVGSFSIQSSLTQVQLLQILGSYESHDFDPTQLDKFPCILFQFWRYSLQMSAAGIELLYSWLLIDSLTHSAMASSLYQSRNCIFPTNNECRNDSDSAQKKKLYSASSYPIQKTNHWFSIQICVKKARKAKLKKAINILLTIGHAGDWVQDPPHAKRVWYHHTTCHISESAIDLLAHNVTKNIDAIIHRTLRGEQNMDKQGMEVRASRMLSGCDTTTPHARWVLNCQTMYYNILHTRLAPPLWKTNQWTCKGLSPAPPACKAGVIPLHHMPDESQRVTRT